MITCRVGQVWSEQRSAPSFHSACLASLPRYVCILPCFVLHSWHVDVVVLSFAFAGCCVLLLLLLLLTDRDKEKDKARADPDKARQKKVAGVAGWCTPGLSHLL